MLALSLCTMLFYESSWSLKFKVAKRLTMTSFLFATETGKNPMRFFFLGFSRSCFKTSARSMSRPRRSHFSWPYLRSPSQRTKDSNRSKCQQIMHAWILTGSHSHFVSHWRQSFAYIFSHRVTFKNVSRFFRQPTNYSGFFIVVGSKSRSSNCRLNR